MAKISGTSPSEVGSAVEFPARSEDPAVVLAYQSANSWVVMLCNLATRSARMSLGSRARSSMMISNYLTTCDSDFAGIVNVHHTTL